MTMKFLKDAVYSEKYTDRKTGEERTKYTNVGALFEREDGSMCVKIQVLVIHQSMSSKILFRSMYFNATF